jgi:hypothetical protein
MFPSSRTRSFPPTSESSLVTCHVSKLTSGAMKKQNLHVVPVGDGGGVRIASLPSLHQWVGLNASPAMFIYPSKTSNKTPLFVTFLIVSSYVLMRTSHKNLGRRLTGKALFETPCHAPFIINLVRLLIDHCHNLVVASSLNLVQTIQSTTN